MMSFVAVCWTYTVYDTFWLPLIPLEGFESNCGLDKSSKNLGALQQM
jgi:hypothetical protein